MLDQVIICDNYCRFLTDLPPGFGSGGFRNLPVTLPHKHSVAYQTISRI